MPKPKARKAHAHGVAVSFCHGITPQGTTCQVAAGNVAENGFCAHHQNQVTPYVMKQMEHLTHELQSLDSLSGTELDRKQVDQLIHRMDHLKKVLKKGQTICEDECEHSLREVIITLKELIGNAPQVKTMLGYGQESPVDRLKMIEQTMTQQAMASKGNDVEARRISLEWEAAKRQKERNDRELVQATQKFQTLSGNAQSREMEFQQALKKLSQELDQAQQGKQTLEAHILQLQQAMSTCQAQSSQISGVHTQTIRALKQELLKFKGLYDNMVGREIKLSQSIKQLTDNEQLLKRTMDELNAKHQEELKKLQTEADTAGVPATQREAELEAEIESLKVSLQEATKELQLAHDAGKEVLERVSTLEAPSGDLAKQMIRINTELHQQSQNSARLEAELAEARDMLAHKELACANAQQQINGKLRQEIVDLNNQIYNLQTMLRDRQSVVAKLQQDLQALKMTSEGQVGQMQQRLSMAQAALMQIRANVQQEKAQAANQMRVAQAQMKARENELDLKFAQMKESLNARFMDRSRQLQEKYEYTVNQLEDERRNLGGIRNQLQQTSQAMQQKEGQLQAMRSAFEQKQAEFLQQKDRLASALTEAKGQAQQFGEMERQHQLRVNMLRQKVAVDRQRYEQEVSSLQAMINRLKGDRVNIVNNLERCGAARDALVVKNNQLLDENTRLKDQLAQARANMDMMRAQFQTTMAKMRTDAAKLQRDVRACASRMQDVSMVHDHMMRTKQEAEGLRTKLRAQIAASKANEQAFQRLLRDRELNKQEVARLQEALQSCGMGKQNMGRQLIDLNKQLYEIKNIDSNLKGQIQDLSDDYQRAMMTQEADMHRQVMQQKMQEQQYVNQLVSLQSQNTELNQQLQRSEEQGQVLRDTVADTEVQNAQQVQRLMQAQQLQAGRTPLTGKSTLVQK